MVFEHLVPMKKEEWSFFEKQKSLFSSMHSDMDTEWASFDQELEKIKREMFTLTPMDFGDFGSSMMPSLTSGSDSSATSSSSSKITKKITTKTTTTKTTSSTKGGSSLSSEIDSALESAGFGSSTMPSLGSGMDTGMGAGMGSALDSAMLKVDKPFVTDMDGNKKLSLRFDVSQFKPEEITVKTLDNQLMIAAKHTEETANRKVYREFSKRYVLPNKIDPLMLDSILSKDGVLSIHAPAPEAIDAPRERILPIQRLLL